MKVLVTGAAGFIGSYTVRELIRQGHTVVAFDRHDRRSVIPAGAEPYLGDTTNATSVMEAMARVDAFIHLAGVLGTQETVRNPLPAAETNIIGGLNVFMAAAQYDVPGVYIAVGNHWMNNTYSITKSTMERFVRMYNKELGTSINIVRPTNCFGPGQSAYPPYGSSKVRKITPAFVNAAIRDLPIEVYGDGEQVSDMIYVEDVARTLVAAMDHAEKGFVYDYAFEVGYGDRITVNQVAETVIRVADSKSVLTHLPMRPGEEPGGVVLADPSTLEVLGITKASFIPLDEGLKRTVEYFQGLQ